MVYLHMRYARYDLLVTAREMTFSPHRLENEWQLVPRGMSRKFADRLRRFDLGRIGTLHHGI